MEEGRLPLPALVFDAGDQPGEAQFEIFHDTTAPLFTTEPVGAVDRFEASAVDVQVDDVMVSAIRSTAQVLRRTDGHVTPGETDWVAVLVPRAGGLRGEAGRGTALDAVAGRITVVDLAHPFELRTAGTDLVWVSLPRARVPAMDAPAVGGAVVSWARDAPAGRAVADAVEAVWDALPSATVEEAPTLADRLVEVVGRALVSGASALPPPGLPASMRRFLRDNLDDLDLGVPALRAAFHCSRSSVYRAFEADGGVATFIRRERLGRCYRALTSTAGPPPRISEVATRWGFESPSHFHRLFKAAYGVAPSVAVERAREAAAVGPPYEVELARRIDRFHDWAVVR